MISFDPFWKTLESKEISQYRLIKEYGISAGQLSRMRKNEYVSTHTIDILCNILDCKVEEIIIFHKCSDSSG